MSNEAFAAAVMQCYLCKLRTHQWCFLLFNILLFHALLFGADFVEEYLLQPSPVVYTDGMVADVRERARKLDLSTIKQKVSRDYIISNPDACRKPDLFLLALVFSSPANITQRNAVRRTWANQTQIQESPIKVLFFTASTESSTIQQDLIKESELHGDLIQNRVVDVSSLYGAKENTLLALRWIITFCPRAHLVLLTEDSVFINLPAIGSYLRGLHRNSEDLYLGRVIQKESPDRNPNSPRYLSRILHPGKYIPEYCEGTAYILSQDVVRKVYVASSTVLAPIPVDIFVGFCAQKAGVTPTHSARFSGERHIHYNACCYRHLFSSAGMGSQELERVWQDLEQKGGKCSLLKTYSGLVACKVRTYLDKMLLQNSKEQT
ncbi:putative UDP-GlcNAc:betaGal beta-1,3-N-acetylglucosaminyltransferase LOC100288842 [Xiphophorus maculatus]|uniref:putative UDP-GlcNAc:betaGal beta-1,3-N-acetylglucosaminyltransferase LOC100288842 n=1 Tax=Xiphophorus maculatus TaxID=8083 RepID=UPI0006D931F3|nr:putative UDP-GlcNAc:betaGal beta-1,3-N-acetylglucosaminyltransferase LOC100288842 [Xiphophorus maculatus]